MSADSAPTEGSGASAPRHFLHEIVEADRAAARQAGHALQVHTRFPPEPNGYLHIGHAKSICLNFGLAAEFGGLCNLRFDDTNPSKENEEFVQSIQADVRWLGFDWKERLYFASDFFEELYAWARHLIETGVAYVDELSAEEIREYRGTGGAAGTTAPGKNSPWRERPIAESLDLFARMRAGEFPDGSKTLRAKIDMASPNLNLRDPVLYRIQRAHHHRTGDAWCIYPMYDWAHGQCDALEGITHSICTLEFENHRPLYDWCLDHLPVPSRPKQIEFARLSLTHTVLSKRRLTLLVSEGHVAGWTDPRMPTVAGFRRRGYTPEAIRNFCAEIGVTRVNGVIDFGRLENAVREDLNRRAPRRMAILDPLKLVLVDYPEGKTEELTAEELPGDPAAGTRQVPFSRELWIERDDFREEAPRKWHRLAPGNEVRLRYAYYVKVVEVIKDSTGQITELRATHDPASRGGGTPDNRTVRGTIHWVSAPHAADLEVRLYDHLFREPHPGERTGDFLDDLNPDSLRTVIARAEPSLRSAAPGFRCQFERLGYFCADEVESRPSAPIFNRTVTLRDTWAKIESRQGRVATS